jgi:hypothetical protein
MALVEVCVHELCHIWHPQYSEREVNALTGLLIGDDLWEDSLVIFEDGQGILPGFQVYDTTSEEEIWESPITQPEEPDYYTQCLSEMETADLTYWNRRGRRDFPAKSILRPSCSIQRMKTKETK